MGNVVLNQQICNWLNEEDEDDIFSFCHQCSEKADWLSLRAESPIHMDFKWCLCIIALSAKLHIHAFASLTHHASQMLNYSMNAAYPPWGAGPYCMCNAAQLQWLNHISSSNEYYLHNICINVIYLKTRCNQQWIITLFISCVMQKKQAAFAFFVCNFSCCPTATIKTTEN